jgi:hypothetical protein
MCKQEERVVTSLWSHFPDKLSFSSALTFFHSFRIKPTR